MNYHIEVTDGHGNPLQTWDCEDFAEVSGTLNVQFDESNAIFYRVPEGSVTRVSVITQGGFDQ